MVAMFFDMYIAIYMVEIQRRDGRHMINRRVDWLDWFCLVMFADRERGKIACTRDATVRRAKAWLGPIQIDAYAYIGYWAGRPHPYDRLSCVSHFITLANVREVVKCRPTYS